MSPMEWTCPHCNTRLASSDEGSAMHAPKPGWRYVRCFSCRGYAMADRQTGEAVPIASAPPKPAPSAPAPAPPAAPAATPPPFRPVAAARPRPGAEIPFSALLEASSAAPPLDATSAALRAAAAMPILEAEAPQDLKPAQQQQQRGGRRMRRFIRRKLTRLTPAQAASVTAILALGAALASGNRLTSAIVAYRAAASPEASIAAQAEKSARADAAASRFAAGADAAAAAVPALPLTDSIASAPAAPIRAGIEAGPAPRAPAPRRLAGTPAEAAKELQLYLHARDHVRRLDLRGGPGVEFPLAGQARLDHEYPVLEWRGRWFKIGLDENARRTAWVHYDKIELSSDEDMPGATE